MGAAEVEAFLTALAVEGRVAASTQNQAMAALLFLYQHVLEKSLGSIDALAGEAVAGRALARRGPRRVRPHRRRESCEGRSGRTSLNHCTAFHDRVTPIAISERP